MPSVCHWGCIVFLFCHPYLSDNCPCQIEGELRKEIANDKTSKKRHVLSFPLCVPFPPNPACYCGNYSRCITSRLNSPSFCSYSQKATIRRRAQFKQKNLPSSLCYSTRALTTVAERREGKKKKKINAVKCGDRKMSFWQMQGFVYAQIEFWWISPQARPPFLIYRPSYKNVKQWCYRKQIQMSLAQKSPNELVLLCLRETFSFQRQTAIWSSSWKLTWLFLGNCYTRLILIWLVIGYLHREINANEFALVQTEVWAYCQAFDACNGFHSYLQAAAEG